MSTSDRKPRLFSNLWAKETPAQPVRRPFCDCLSPGEEGRKWTELYLHTECQDTTCAGWKRLVELIDQAAEDGREEFSPARDMKGEEWAEITVLPRSIAKLKRVKRLLLYGSSLVRIPPEIGEMTALQEFVPYTSYRLHWFPYEITRCKKLRDSTISTRALYGNNKYRPPFPKLPQLHPEWVPERCSVCNSFFPDGSPRQVWISLRVATDVVPLLVHACSTQCLQALPKPPEGYVPQPHQGGLDLKQAPARW